MTDTANALKSRPIDHVHRGIPTSDGAGVKLTRLLGHQGLMQLDPFLMLDYFSSDNADDYIAGFPEHPHRGFETVTIMIEGKMRHGDNKGHSGVIENGGIQWMTAGRGIVHSEIPEQTDGRMWGFQLWVNLPSHLKMTDPGYQEFPREEIPVDERDGASVRVLAGELASGLRGPARSAAIDPLLLDITLQPGARFVEAVPAELNGFIAVYRGRVTAVDTEVSTPALAVLGKGDQLDLVAGPDGASLLIVAGKPIGEPVARYGPFVMNTQAELQQAVTDFQAGRF
ncbi:pirin family protein [Maricaulis sp.]|uniref:pirin family protein n=1 Tax=Maricaulis sp. TaxID=1486257 RepID=UPI001B042817|nr:pirin family protein [Maricaulis sp.]MBO6797729.1 pirin family protein [Maricaulis sp.]